MVILTKHGMAVLDLNHIVHAEYNEKNNNLILIGNSVDYTLKCNPIIAKTVIDAIEESIIEEEKKRNEDIDDYI